MSSCPLKNPLGICQDGNWQVLFGYYVLVSVWVLKQPFLLQNWKFAVCDDTFIYSLFNYLWVVNWRLLKMISWKMGIQIIVFIRWEYKLLSVRIGDSFFLSLLDSETMLVSRISKSAQLLILQPNSGSLLFGYDTNCWEQMWIDSSHSSPTKMFIASISKINLELRNEDGETYFCCLFLERVTLLALSVLSM